MRSTAALAILATLMTGCATVRVAGECPALPAPPAAAVEALEAAGGPAVDGWVVDLANHYDKIEVCRNPARR